MSALTRRTQKSTVWYLPIGNPELKIFVCKFHILGQTWCLLKKLEYSNVAVSVTRGVVGRLVGLKGYFSSRMSRLKKRSTSWYMYIHIYLYIHLCIWTYKCKYMYIYTFMYMLIYSYIYIWLYIYIYIYIYIRIYTHTHIYIYIYVYIYMYIHIYI